MTILLAEDNPDDVLLFKRLLDRVSPDLNIHVVRDGTETIEYLSGSGSFADRSAHPLPSLILLDIRMPKMNGLEVLEWIRRHPRLSGMPVVMLTDSESKEHLSRAYELNVNSYLNKRPSMGLPQVFKDLMDHWGTKSGEPPELGQRI
jgi:CheY-like chemotaxis protein